MTLLTNAQVIEKLSALYDLEFGGKPRGRFLLSWDELRQIRGGGRLEEGVFERLWHDAKDAGLYLEDHGLVDGMRIIAVVKARTANRWRRLPRRIAERYRNLPDVA